MSLSKPADKGAVAGGAEILKEASGMKPPDTKEGAATTTEEVVAQDPIAMLSADHRKVEELFGTFEQSSSPEQKIQLAEELCTELVIHALLEEEIFYPACKGHMDDRLLNEAQVEHDGAKTLIVEVQSGSLDDPYFEAKVKVLADEIKHHVTEEERPNSGIFAKAVHAKINTADMAKKLGDRKKQLLEKAMAGDLGWPETRSFRVQTNVGTRRLMEENSMARNSSSSLERDERGRFVNDDDEREDRRRSSGRSRSDVDEDRRPSRSRDEDGRFTSSRSRSRDDDDDDRGRGQRGWFGDSEGHAEAARRGRDDRESPSRRASRDDDDDRRSSRSRDDDGRFTSSRSRSRDDDDDDRRSSRSRDDDGRFTSSRSRSRDDDDDDRRSSRSRDDDGRFTSSRSRSRDDDDDDRRSSRSRDDDGRFTSSRSRDDDDDDRRSSRSRDDDGRFTSSRSRSRDDDDDDRRSSRSRDDDGRFTSSRSRSRDDDDDDRRSSRSRDDADDGRRGSRGHGGWFGDPEGHAEAARRGRR